MLWRCDENACKEENKIGVTFLPRNRDWTSRSEFQRINRYYILSTYVRILNGNDLKTWGQLFKQGLTNV